MADVFISYKSEDRAAAKAYAEALAREGFSVWWDPVLRTGETYDEVIEGNLRQAALVVVLWSPRSVKSKWVRAEATIGERKGALLPVLIEACDRPIAFELLQTADLVGWAGDRADPRWRDFVADLQSALATRRQQERAHTAPAAPDALTIETLFWSSIKDGADAADFEAYAQRYPNGHFVAIARNKARALRGFPPPRLDDGAAPSLRPRWLVPAALALAALVLAWVVLGPLLFPPETSEQAAEISTPSPQRGEGREGGRAGDGASGDVALNPARPLPLPPPPGAGENFRDCAGFVRRARAGERTAGRIAAPAATQGRRPRLRRMPGDGGDPRRFLHHGLA